MQILAAVTFNIMCAVISWFCGNQDIFKLAAFAVPHSVLAVVLTPTHLFNRRALISLILMSGIAGLLAADIHLMGWEKRANGGMSFAEMFIQIVWCGTPGPMLVIWFRNTVQLGRKE